MKDSGADCVGFSVYMWNLRRSLGIAHLIRAAAPGVSIVMGGPEIAEERPALLEIVDSLIIGEGEGGFAALLEDLSAGRAPARTYSGAPLPDLSIVPNPYLSGFLEREPGDPMYLETMRGCPNNCAYCYYGKAYPRVRRFPEERLGQAFAWARAHGVPEIYLMDPAYDATPRWDTALETLKRLNTTRIPLHTELRLESVTEKRAALMKDAGFRSVEVGLQSVTEEALDAVGRRWDRTGFVKGAGLLTQTGITVKTGIILGLPRDTLEGFKDTVRFVDGLGLAGALEVYPLSILPGTRLRDSAAELGISWMSAPPYWVLSTPTMSQEEMMEAIRWTEDFLDAEIFLPVVPRFTDPPGGFTGFLDLRPAGALEEAAASINRLSHTVTLLFDGEALSRITQLEDLGRKLMEQAPSTMTRIVVESDAPLDPALMDRLAEAFHDPAHYANASNYFNEDPQGRFSVRLYRLASRPQALGRAEEEPWDLILRATPRILQEGPRLLSGKPMLLVEEPLPPEAEAAVSALYSGYEGLVIRAGREEHGPHGPPRRSHPT